MSLAEIGGSEINYEDRGEGLPLVLVHGFPLDAQIWRAQLELSRLCRVITPDLPGFGQSSPPAQPFSIDSLADDLHAFLKQIRALPCILGGLSMGGYVALAFAAKHRRDLKGLILTDTRSAADAPPGKAARDAMIELARTQGSSAVADQMLPRMLATPRLNRVLKEIMDACPAQTIQYACAAMRDRKDYTDSLRKIGVPTLILVGESDQLTPPEMSRALHAAIPGSTLLIVLDAGHLSPLEQPGRVNLAIAEFLSQIEK